MILLASPGVVVCVGYDNIICFWEVYSNSLIKTIKPLVVKEGSGAHYCSIASQVLDTIDGYSQVAVVYLGSSSGQLAECVITKNKVIPEATSRNAF